METDSVNHAELQNVFPLTGTSGSVISPTMSLTELYFYTLYSLDTIQRNTELAYTASQDDPEDTVLLTASQHIQLQIRTIAVVKILTILENCHTESKQSTSPTHYATHQAFMRTQIYMEKGCTCFVALVYKY